MSRSAWCMVAIVAMGMLLAMTTGPASAADYPNVAQMQPWAAESNYMSLPGYLRWMTFKEQGVWLSMVEAKRIVAEQQQNQ